MCSRVLWDNKNPTFAQPIVVGRNMDWDWDNPLETQLRVYPRGMRREAGVTQNPLLPWTAKYGSLVATVSWFADKKRKITATADGINERRLAGHLLWLEDSDYGKRDLSRPGLSVGLWLQYCLDKCATVAEVKRLTLDKDFRLEVFDIQGQKAHLHLAVEDHSGKSMIVEYHKHENRFAFHTDKIVTNSQTCKIDKKELRNSRKENGRMLPGSTVSAHRYARADWFLKRLPPPTSERQTIAYLLSVMRNVSQPFRQDKRMKNSQPSATWWRTVCDLSNGYYYFDSAVRANIVWMGLDDLDFTEDASPMRLDLGSDNSDPVGNVASLFKPHQPADWESP